mgnify:CR=1 FL=1
MAREFSVGAVLFRRDAQRHYLLLHYEAGHWDFPKGNVERGEKPKMTASREIKEETGIEDISFIPGFDEKIRYFYKREKKTVAKEVEFLLGETKTEEVKLSFEHIGFEWLEYEGACERTTFRNSKDILKKAEGFLLKLGNERPI